MVLILSVWNLCYYCSGFAQNSLLWVHRIGRLKVYVDPRFCLSDQHLFYFNDSIFQTFKMLHICLVSEICWIFLWKVCCIHNHFYVVMGKNAWLLWMDRFWNKRLVVFHGLLFNSYFSLYMWLFLTLCSTWVSFKKFINFYNLFFFS